MADEFVSLISHELRTPLTSILGYLELVIDDEGLPSEKQREFLRRAQNNANHLVYVLNSVHELSRLDRGGPPIAHAQVYVHQLLREVADGFRSRCDCEQLTLTVGPVEEGIDLVTDRECLSRAVVHLLSNACKYTPAGGTVRLSAHNEGDGIAIDIEDSGIGIPEEEYRRVFTRFYRGSNARVEGAKGAGLGLAIAKSLLSLLGGDLTFRSQPGDGSVFTLHLPLVPPEYAPLD